MTESNATEAAELISSYSRAEAIADGALVAVAEGIAREAGFCSPVALTRAAFDDCVAWSDADSARTGVWLQDETGRLWDVLFMARRAADGARGADRLTFQLYRVPCDRGRIPIDDLTEDEHEALCRVSLVLVCGPGDQAEPVLTIMRPDED
jgi:Family of unknown function (DUF6573)